MKRRIGFFCLLFAAALLVACSGPAEKKAKFYRKGQALYEKKDYVKAGLEFKNALQIDPKFADGWYMLGMTQLLRGDFPHAYGSFNKAAELEPDHVKAQTQLGKILVAAGKRDEAIEKAELVLKKEPRNEEAQLIKGVVYLAEKKNAKARAHLETLLDPRSLPAPGFDVYAGEEFSGCGEGPFERDRGKRGVRPPVPGVGRPVRRLGRGRGVGQAGKACDRACAGRVQLPDHPGGPALEHGTEGKGK
jgi:tetratricopeptide (TPR) repeat protein